MDSYTCDQEAMVIINDADPTKIRSFFLKEGPPTINKEEIAIDINISDPEKITIESENSSFDSTSLNHSTTQEDSETYEYQNSNWVFEFNLNRKPISSENHPIKFSKFIKNFDEYILNLVNNHLVTYDKTTDKYRIFLDIGDGILAIVEHYEDTKKLNMFTSYHKEIHKDVKMFKNFPTLTISGLNLWTLFSFNFEDENKNKTQLVIRRDLKKTKSDEFCKEISNNIKKNGKLFIKPIVKPKKK